MTLTLSLVCLIVAAICFLVAALPVLFGTNSKVAWVPMGYFFVTLSVIFLRTKGG